MVVNLFLGMEDINKRKFDRPNLHDEILQDRGLILSALYCLIRNWYNQGMPKGKELFTSFPEWAAICGGIIEAAGYENPLKNVKVDEVGMDDETADMKCLFEYMHEKYADDWLTKKTIRDIIMTDDEFGSTIFGWLELDKRAGQTKFGFLMDKYNGREFEKVIMKVDETVKRKSRQKICFTSVDSPKKINDEVVK